MTTHSFFKNLVRNALLGVAIVAAASLASAKDDFAGFIEIRKNHELYVRWTKAQPGQPTVVLLNGLTYTTKQWDDFANVLIHQGLGVVRYDMFGMGETLLKYAPLFRPVSYQEQVEDLDQLTQQLGLDGKLNIVGLSYGGGIAMAFGATYPERVRNLVLMAPYTQPLEDQDKWVRSQIWYTRQVQPWNPASDDDLYDYYLRQIVFTSYPMVEPVVLENPFKLEGVFRMVQGIRKWTSDQAVGLLPRRTVHLMIAGNDQYLKRHVMEEFWASVPAEVRASVIVVNNSEHKIPEAVPFFSGSWVAEIARRNPVVSGGREFDADPYAGTVRYEGGSLTFPREREGRGTTIGGGR